MSELHFTLHHALTLSKQHVLEGHGGCVNRVTWSPEGDKLLSGSDDKKLMLWDYPDTTRSPLRIDTQHRANIFGAAILPHSNNTLLVSCAMDNSVQLHQLTPCGGSSSSSNTPRSLASASAANSTSFTVGINDPRRGLTRTSGAGESRLGGDPAARARVRVTMSLQDFTAQHGSDAVPNVPSRAGVRGYAVRNVQPQSTRVYNCHTSRVKDVKSEPGNAHNFWSAGEDGYVRQYDTRISNHTTFASPNVLIHTRGPSSSIEVKALDISKAQPHLLAIACGDPFVRIYDRRKLSTGLPDPGRGKETQSLLQLAPPHISLGTTPRGARSHTTYVNFSHRGDKVIASYHGDHVYSFDITSSGAMAACYEPSQPGLQQPSVVRTYTDHCADIGSAELLAAFDRRRAGPLQPLFNHHLQSQQPPNPGEPIQKQPSPEKPQIPAQPPSKSPTPAAETGSSPTSESAPSLQNSSIDSSGSATPVPPHCYEIPLQSATGYSNDSMSSVQSSPSSSSPPHPPASSLSTVSERIAHHSGMLQIHPPSALHLCKRAEALLARGWVGDAIWALRDCDAAANLDPLCFTALCLRIKAMKELGQFKTALLLISLFQGSPAATELRVKDAVEEMSLRFDLHQLGLECTKQVQQRRHVFEEAQMRRAQRLRRDKEEAEAARARAASLGAGAAGRRGTVLDRLEARLAEGVTTARASAVLAAGAAAGAAAGMVAARVAGWREFTMVGPYPNLAAATDAVHGIQLDTGQLGPMLSIHVATEFTHDGNVPAGQQRQYAADSHNLTELDSAVHTFQPDASSAQDLIATATSGAAAPSTSAAGAAAAAADAGTSSFPFVATEVPVVDGSVSLALDSSTLHPSSLSQVASTGLDAPRSLATSPIQPQALTAQTVSVPDTPVILVTNTADAAPGIPPTAATNVGDTMVPSIYTSDGAQTLTNNPGSADNTTNLDASMQVQGGGSTYQNLACTLPLPVSSSDLDQEEVADSASDLDLRGDSSDLDEGETAAAVSAHVADGRVDQGLVEQSLPSETGVQSLPDVSSVAAETPEDFDVESEEEEEEEDADLEGDPVDHDPDDEVYLSLYTHQAPAATPSIKTGCSSSGGTSNNVNNSCIAASAWGVSEGSRRLLQRYIGQINLQTDIKECVFVGRGDRLVACGSDDGRVYIYDTQTGKLVKILLADEDVVNCVQCHPFLPVLATSGIEKVIRIWSPGGDQKDPKEVTRRSSESLEMLVTQNQDRLREGPALRSDALRSLSQHPQLWTLLLSQMARQEERAAAGRGAADGANAAGSGDDSDAEPPADLEDSPVSCRVS